MWIRRVGATKTAVGSNLTTPSAGIRAKTMYPVPLKQQEKTRIDKLDGEIIISTISTEPIDWPPNGRPCEAYPRVPPQFCLYQYQDLHTHKEYRRLQRASLQVHKLRQGSYAASDIPYQSVQSGTESGLSLITQICELTLLR